MWKMKKILTVTFNKANNHGAVLQMYSLQKILKEKYDTKVLNNYDEKMVEIYHYISKPKGNLKAKIKIMIKNIIFFHYNKKRYDKFSDFINSKVILTDETNNKEKLNKITEKYDVIITGSDQVWNSEITNGLSDIYTLNFGSKNTKRISYAASLGRSYIEENQKKEYKNKLKVINNMSVREESGKKALKELFPEKNIEVVIDPTLLLSKEDWSKEIKEIPLRKEKYILAYMVAYNEEYVKIVNELSQKTGLKIIHFDIKNYYKNTLKSAYTEGPLEFVSLIKNAEYIVATSFHATVFSIIFNKKFWIVPHLTTGSRVTDLLKKLKISNRTIKNLEEFKSKNYDEAIDYEKVNTILKEEREKSRKWLFDAIDK